MEIDAQAERMEGGRAEYSVTALRGYLTSAELKLGRSITVEEVGELTRCWREGTPLADAVAQVRDRSGV